MATKKTPVKKPAAAAALVQVELPPIDVQHIQVRVVGDSPLITHRWSEKARKEMLDKQMKKAKSAKEAKDPEVDFRSVDKLLS